MNSNQLYLSSSNELMQVRNIQLQISQKELELQMLDINTKYSSYDPYSYSSNSIKRQNIELEVINLKHNRDMHLGFAIEAALLLAEWDIRNNNVYSMAEVSISSINSFLQSQKIDFRLQYSTQAKLSQISSLLYTNNNFTSLKSEITRLKMLCNIYY